MTVEESDYIEYAKQSAEAAEVLLHSGSPDFAVSRAYYAIFYVATALLMRKGLALSKHSAVIAAFGREYVKTNQVSAEFHEYLIDAQRARISSDYVPLSQYTSEDAARYIGYAREFIELGERLLSEEPSQAGEVSDHEE